MKTVNLVQASAEIVSIVSLKKGDVYKRLEKSYTGYAIHIGIVTDVLHNGEDAALTALEYITDLSNDVKAEMKVFGTDTDLKIFAATEEEFTSHLESITKSAERRIVSLEKDLEKAQRVRKAVNELSQNIEMIQSPQVVLQEASIEA